MIGLRFCGVYKAASNLVRISCFRKFSDITQSNPFVYSVVEGKIDTSQVFPYPKVLTEEQEDTIKLLIDPIEKFFEESNDALKNDELEDIDKSTMEGLKGMGACGMMVPEKYGGIGLNNTQYGRMIQVVGKYDLGVAIVLGAHQSIGYKGIVLYGSEEQKKKYLPKLVTGEWFASYCLTEPGSGSDAMSIKTKAVLSPDGKHYILNGSKIWISNAGFADLFTVFAKTLVKDKDGNEKEKVTAFIVERGFGGVTSGPPEKKMGIKCSNTAAVYFEDCKVPVENVIGEPGKGFKIAMEILNNGRFGMAGALSGTMKTCIAKASIHSAERKQFQTTIKDFKLMQEKLATMQIKQYTTESMAFVISSNMDRKVKSFEVEAAISKVYASEAAWFCADEAIQILGGMGYMRETGLEKIMRDLRIFRIFEGTNEILRLLAVGVCLKNLQKNSKSTSDHVTRAFINIMGFNYMQNKAALQKVVDPSLHKSADKLAKSIYKTNITLNSALMKHKMKLVTHESIKMSRFADCLIEIFGMACVLSRATESLKNSKIEGSDISVVQAEHEKILAELACTLAAKHVNESLAMVQIDDQNELDGLKTITDDLCNNGGTVQSSPLGF